MNAIFSNITFFLFGAIIVQTNNKKLGVLCIGIIILIILIEKILKISQKKEIFKSMSILKKKSIHINVNRCINMNRDNLLKNLSLFSNSKNIEVFHHNLHEESFNGFILFELNNKKFYIA